MGEHTDIAWCHHSFNAWWGCQRVSPGCQNCYSEAFDKRVGGAHWGPTASRRMFGEQHWAEPLKWNTAAAKAGERRRVFTNSMADVFEDRPELTAPRARLFELIRQTPNLDWLLLTKRPENIMPCIQEALRTAIGAQEIWLRGWMAGHPPFNVWLGTSVENQEWADNRVPGLLEVPAAIRFVSAEPLLGPLDFRPWILNFFCAKCREYFNVPDGDNCPNCGGGDCWMDACAERDPDGPTLDWIIIGGESGGKARPCEVAWIRDIMAQCAAAGVACFVKQLGACAMGQVVPGSINSPVRNLNKDRYLRDRKGANPAEWPEDLRVREFPEPAQRDAAAVSP